MSTLLCSHGGSAKDAEFTTERLRQMKLYSNSRIRYTLHKAVEIAYANANALKASDFGVMDQVFFVVVVLLCFCSTTTKYQKWGMEEICLDKAMAEKMGQNLWNGIEKFGRLGGGPTSIFSSWPAGPPEVLKKFPFQGVVSLSTFSRCISMFLWWLSQDKNCAFFGQEHEIFFWIIDLFLVCIFCCSSVFLG